MKNFSLLPRAEHITQESFYDDSPVEKDKFGIKPGCITYLILSVIMVISMFAIPFLGMILFGAIFILASFDKSARLWGNADSVENTMWHENAENTMWNRLPLLFAGIFIEILSVVFIISNKKDEEQGSRVFGTLLVMFVAAIAIVMIGRLIFLIACVIAASKRKAKCTECISAEYYSDTQRTENVTKEPEYFIDKNNRPVCKYYYNGKYYQIVLPQNASGDKNSIEPLFAGYKQQLEKMLWENDHNINENNHLVFRYYYQGEYYRFTAPQDVPVVIDDNNCIEIFVDPTQPDCYYSGGIFSQNTQKLKRYLGGMAILLAIIGVILTFANLRNIMDFFIEKY